MAKPKRKKPAITYEAPTPEQMAKGSFAQGGKCATGLNDRNGLAYRRIPVIDTMSQTGKLTDRQHRGLERYRVIATAEEKSPIRDSLDKALQGRGNGLALIVKMGLSDELAYLQKALGRLQPIAHAIAVHDETVSQWAIKTGGSNGDGSPKRFWAQSCMIEIGHAGDKLADAIGA